MADEDIWFHHDARFNAGMVAQNLTLLQDHYSLDPCADCCLKHSQLIKGYAEEGLTLDNADTVRPELEEAIDLIVRHMKTILSCTDEKGACKIKSEKDVERMISEVRTLRRKINIKVYGLHGDVTHDWIGEKAAHVHDHSGHNHSHDHDEEPFKATGHVEQPIAEYDHHGSFEYALHE